MKSAERVLTWTPRSLLSAGTTHEGVHTVRCGATTLTVTTELLVPEAHTIHPGAHDRRSGGRDDGGGQVATAVTHGYRDGRAIERYAATHGPPPPFTGCGQLALVGRLGPSLTTPPARTRPRTRTATVVPN